jgi:hypothetical protein
MVLCGKPAQIVTMSHKAHLGFKVLSLDDELQVSDEKDFEKDRLNREYLSHQKAKASKLRCYHKHADTYNKTKRKKSAKISGRYKSARQGALKRNTAWEFSEDEWEHAWLEAGWIRIPGTQSAANPTGDVVPAFALRGAHRYNNTCMQRLNLDKPWSNDNYKIMYRGEEVGPENQWSLSNSEHEELHIKHR